MPHLIETSTDEQLAQTRRELIEARELQAASAEVLRVISTSRNDVQPVFDAIAESAVRLCQGQFSFVLRLDKDLMHFGACYGLTVEGLEAFRRELPRPVDEGTVSGRAILQRAIAEIPDVLADPAYGVVGLARKVTYRSALAVPMLRQGTSIGAIAVARAQVGPFTAGQIALLTTFADQAVIAIENARLFNETKEALEQQKATSEVLQIISSSPGQLQPVFEAMLTNATRLCEASLGLMYLCEGDLLRMAALHGDLPGAFKEKWRPGTLFRPHPDVAPARAVRTCTVVHIADLRKDRAYLSGDPLPVAGVEVAGIRTLVVIPMLKENKALGAISIYRKEVRPFTNKQVELVTNFAAQAVIAIENTRLLNELRESLQQQTATADVLKVISRSTFDLRAVLNTLVESAARLCEADTAIICRPKGEFYETVASHGASPDFYQYMQSHPIPIGPGTITGQAALEGRAIHVHDVLADPDYKLSEAQRRGGYRTTLGVPLLREGIPIGVMAMNRLTVRPFTDKQIDLVTTFADQAVIAIENVRLFDEVQTRTKELQESLEYQTATSDVLNVISRSPNVLQPVLDSIVRTAARLCAAEYSVVFRLRKGKCYMAAGNAQDEFIEFLKEHPIVPTRASCTGRAVLERRTVHVLDASTDPEYAMPDYQLVARNRTMLGVPLLREGVPLGTITLWKTIVEPFTEKQIELVTTFGDQAVIAIENVRLFEEVQARTRELSQSVAELQALGEVSQAVNSTLDLETVLSTIVAKAVQLSGTEAGAIYGYDERLQEFRLHATHGMTKAMIAALARQHIGLKEPLVAPALIRRGPIQFADLREEASTAVNEIILRAGFRALLVAPLMRGEEIVGALVVRRRVPGAFPESTVDLIKTFAAQSVLAIQNARLFHEIEEKGRQLAQASQHKSQFLANMSHELRTPLNAIIGVSEMLQRMPRH